jgi:hypothetical protein
VADPVYSDTITVPLYNPSDLRVTNYDPQSNTYYLTWENNSSVATHTVIQRSDDDGSSFFDIDDIIYQGTGYVSYSASSMTPNSQIYFRVYERNDTFVTSDYSNTYSVSAPFSLVTVSAEKHFGNDGAGVLLNWSMPILFLRRQPSIPITF